MPPHYQRLADYLAAHPGDTVRLTFAEIEAIIGAPLPVGAYTTTFWGNAPSRSPARYWLPRGWRAVRQARGETHITFVRVFPLRPARSVSQNPSFRLPAESLILA
jgi:hypothetical protein